MRGDRIRITTPSRLHFGLLARGQEHPRQFGGVGLMIEAPGLVVEARPSSSWSAEGPLAGRVLDTLHRVDSSLGNGRQTDHTLHFTIHRAPPEHVGLGTGTQLSLAIVRLVLAALEEDAPSVARLAALAGRGRRSGIGLHGFVLGGLVVDGGRSNESAFPPLLSRLDFPRDWSILVVIPKAAPGLAGAREVEAFDRLPDLPVGTVDRLCRLVLLGLLPAAVERDLLAFGVALDELQREVGRGFAPAQGGLFAHPHLDAVASAMRGLGLHGVGQSSWGPALFGIAAHDPDRQCSIGRALRTRFTLEESSVFWTTASSSGARIETEAGDRL